MSSISILAMMLTLKAFAVGEDYLLSECKKGKGEYCSYYASKIYNINKAEAVKYFRLACKQGVLSSCVFDENYKKPEPESLPVPEKNNVDAATQVSQDLEAWASNRIYRIIQSLFPTESGVQSSQFTVDQCRMPLAEMMKLAVGLSKSYTHTYRFNPGCDLDGSINITTGNPFTYKVSIQRLGEVTKFECQITLTYEKMENNMFKQNIKTTNAVAYDATGKAIVKFAASHVSEYAQTGTGLSATEKSNYGRINIYEFQGNAVKFEKDFVLDHLIKHMVFHKSGT